MRGYKGRGPKPLAGNLARGNHRDENGDEYEDEAENAFGHLTHADSAERRDPAGAAHEARRRGGQRPVDRRHFTRSAMRQLD
jgi:hypothetical protein